MKKAITPLLSLASAFAFSQVSVVGRESTVSYSYLYGGGPFVWQDSVTDTYNDLVSSDSRHRTYSDHQTGSWASLTFDVSVGLVLDQAWSVTGSLSQAERMQWSSAIDTSSTASGDIPSSQIQSDNPGSLHTLYFDVNSPVRFSINGAVNSVSAGVLTNYVNIMQFDGFSWGHRFNTWFIGSGFGPFSGEGVLEPGQYRVTAQLGNRSFGNQVNSSDGHYDLKFSQTIQPSSIVVRRGRVDAGSVSNLATQDGSSLRVCKFFVPNNLVAPVEVEIIGTTLVMNPTQLTFTMLSRMAVSGSFAQQIDLYDYSTSSFSTSATRTDGTGTTYQRRYLDGAGTMSHFVGPNGEVRARYSVKQTGPSSASLFCHEVDNATWMIVP
ncbi:MAG: hypothetical protein JNM34_04350 [Chthonomonadaceae bacterium]|nr:hypothetical protein [Chthonomonadaceae bacterium]